MSREPMHGNPGPKITTSDPIVDQIVERARKNWELLRQKGRGVYPGAFPYIPVEDRLFSNILEDGEWQGQRCFIIGGAPSLKDFDFSKLKGELVIGINRAYEKIDCTIMFSMDSRYFQWITRGELKGKAREKFINFKGYKIWLNASRYQFPKDVYQLGWVGGHGFSWSLKDGLGGGSNSGFGALNLAVCLGANPIYLLGYDMKGKHWHDDYPIKQPVEVYDKFIERFSKVAPEIKQHGIRVINLNPDSALKCFEFGQLEDIKPITRPIVISYYTKNTGYEKEIAGLINGLRRFNLEYDIEAIDNLGGWQKNTHYKARFIKAMLKKHRRPILFLDSDAIIHRYPFLFNDLDADMACHFKQGSELLTGTIYFANSKKAMKLIDLWIGINNRRPRIWEQRNIQDVIGEWDGKIEKLPPAYCKIFDTMNVEKPVIEHYQASRMHRYEVGN